MRNYSHHGENNYMPKAGFVCPLMEIVLIRGRRLVHERVLRRMLFIRRFEYQNLLIRLICSTTKL